MSTTFTTFIRSSLGATSTTALVVAIFMGLATAPSAQASEPIAIIGGSSFSLNATVGEPLVFTVTSSLTPGEGQVLWFLAFTPAASLNQNSENGSFSWIPTADDVGSRDISLNAFTTSAVGVQSGGSSVTRWGTVYVQAAPEPPDTQAPSLALVSSEVAVGIGTTTIVFTTDEDGAVTYGGSCPSGSLTQAVTGGNNTATFFGLDAGDYTCNIVVTDVAGNASAALLVNFTVQAPPQEIVPDVPPVSVVESSDSAVSSSSGRSGSGRRATPRDSSDTRENSVGEVLGAAVYNFTRDLTLDTSGEDVMALQNILMSQGFFSKEVVPTGYFGLVTLDAVRKYQAARGISATGNVGPLTRAALNAGTTAGLSVEQRAAILTQIEALLTQVLALQAQLEAMTGGE